MANIYHRKDGRWEVRIALGTDENGKRKYRSIYAKTREEAEYKLLLTQQDEPDSYHVTEMTVSELTAEWLHQAQIRLKESTIANYRMKTDKHILPVFGDMQCCQLTCRKVYDFIEKKLSEGLSPRYVSDMIVLMKSIFRYASREYHIRNVLDGIILPKCKKNETVLLSADQQKRLKAYVSANQSLAGLGVSLAMHTGIRIGELCALQWGDIDLEKCVLRVSKTMQRIQTQGREKRTKLVITAPKSNSSVREIPIPASLLPMLRSFAGSADCYVLSGSKKPVEPRTMQYRFAKLLENADLPSVHFHSLRHAFASGCIALGFDVKTLSEILGHSSVELTLNRYVHTSMERKRQCMALLDKAA
jgi:integrase